MDALPSTVLYATFLPSAHGLRRINARLVVPQAAGCPPCATAGTPASFSWPSLPAGWSMVRMHCRTTPSWRGHHSFPREERWRADRSSGRPTPQHTVIGWCGCWTNSIPIDRSLPVTLPTQAPLPPQGRARLTSVTGPATTCSSSATASAKRLRDEEWCGTLVDVSPSVALYLTRRRSMK